MAIGTYAEKFLGVRHAAVCHLSDVVRIQKPPQVRRFSSDPRHLDRLRATPRGIARAAKRATVICIALAELAHIGISLSGPFLQEVGFDFAVLAVGFVHCLLDQEGTCRFDSHVSFSVPVVTGKAGY
jgi:hypothetical protein